MLTHCPECGCKLGPFGKDADIGYTATRDLSQLSLSEGELSILKKMQDTYQWYRLHHHHNSDHENQKRLHEIRGMKYALDVIIKTEDGQKQSWDWQAVLY